MRSRARAVRIPAVALTLALLAVSASAPEVSARAQAYLGVYPDEAMTSCEHAGGGPTVAYVILTNAIGVKEITFRAPVPDCLGGSNAFIYSGSAFPFTGDSQTGVTVDLGECTSSYPVTVLIIYYDGQRTCSTDCGGWPVIDVTFVDCSGVARSGGSKTGCDYTGACEGADVLGPYGPYPADGANGVPTNVTLRWTLPQEACEELFFLDTQWMDNSFYWPGGYFTTWEPAQELEPNTTYVWRPRLACTYDDFYSWPPLWTFTTGEGPVAAKPSTWGRVKALYGE